MIFGMPISWVIVEIFSLLLIFICINHASKQENSFMKILELFGFILGSALFENAGVNFAGLYVYDVRRMIMVGSVPLEIMLIEAAIWYAAFNLALKLNVPKWAIPFVVGLFGSIQDMTIDPAAVFDRYAITNPNIADAINSTHPGALGNSILSGQWNWTFPGYNSGFFGIPVFNFSGWMYHMAYFSLFVLVGRWLYQKYNNKLFGFAYPILAGIINAACLLTPLNKLMLFGNFDHTQSTLLSQSIMLVINYGFAITLLIIFRKRLELIDLKQDGLIIFGLPAIMHIYDIIYAFALGTQIAYIPVVVVSVIHLVYLFVIFRQNKRLTITASASS